MSPGALATAPGSLPRVTSSKSMDGGSSKRLNMAAAAFVPETAAADAGPDAKAAEAEKEGVKTREAKKVEQRVVKAAAAEAVGGA